MRRHASERAAVSQPRKDRKPAPKGSPARKATAAYSRRARVRRAGGVHGCGTYEEDDPGPGGREHESGRTGEAPRPKKPPPQVGQRQGRTGAEAEGDEGVGGPNRSE